MPKAMTVRLPEEKAAELEMIARTDEVSVNEAVRDAIDKHIEARRKDGKFRERVQQHIADNQRLLERLAG